ncbi:MAG: hypothetical protein WD738_19840 [Pirellulales bacterium]
MTVTTSTTSRYRWNATTLEGFVQQLAVGYIARGYFFYVTGLVPERMSTAEHDERLLVKFDIAHSKWSRYRRKLRAGHCGRQVASVQYLRYRDFWVLVATAGEHCFFQEHQKPQAKPWLIEPQYRDVREVPITFGGYSVSWRDRVSVRISPQAYRELKAHFLRLAATESKDSLEREFCRAPFEPYGGVTRQMFAILRAVNRVRRTAGLPLVPRGCIRVRRRVVKPFADTGNGFFNEESLRLAA